MADLASGFANVFKNSEIPKRNASAKTVKSGSTRKSTSRIIVSPIKTSLVVGASETGDRKGAAFNGISLEEVISAKTESPLRPDLNEVDGKKDDKRHGQHDGCDCGSCGVVELFQPEHDEQRQDFRLAWDVACDEDHRAVFAHGSCEGQGKTGQDARQQCWQHYADNRLPPQRSERGRRFLDLAIEVLEHRLHCANDEGEPDEDQGDPDADCGVSDTKAIGSEEAANDTVRRVDCRKGNARNRRGQREGKVDDRIKKASAGKVVTHEHPGDENADYHVEHCRKRRGHKADPQRSQETGPRDDAGKCGPIEFERLQKEPGNGDKHDHQEIEDREAQGQPKTGNDARLAEWDTFHTRYPLLAHGLWRNGAGKLRGNDELRVFACARMRDSKAAIIT